jgi:hypothetical protein
MMRALLFRAEDESGFPPPFSADSINRMHDVAEMFLALAAQVNNRPIPKDFMQYWDELAVPLCRPLSYRAQMLKLNKVRVSLKHYGAEPHASEITAGVRAVRGLLEDECEALFGIPLSAASLSAFVSDTHARDLLDSAERAWALGDANNALADLGDAFGSVLNDYIDRKKVNHGRTPFNSIGDLTFQTPFHRGVSDPKQAKYDEFITKSLKNLDRNIMLVGLGVDLRRHGKFASLMPGMYINGYKERVFFEANAPARTIEDFEFCRDFVVSTALHLAEFDYTLTTGRP